MPRDCQEEKTVDTALTTRCHVGPRNAVSRAKVKASRALRERQLKKRRKGEGGGAEGGRDGGDVNREKEGEEPYEVPVPPASSMLRHAKRVLPPVSRKTEQQAHARHTNVLKVSDRKKRRRKKRMKRRGLAVSSLNFLAENIQRNHKGIIFESKNYM